MRYLLILLLFCQNVYAWDIYNPFKSDKPKPVQIKPITKDMTDDEVSVQCKAISERLRVKFADTSDPHVDMWDKDWINKK